MFLPELVLLCIFHMSVPSLFLIVPAHLISVFVSYVVCTYYPFILSGVIFAIIASAVYIFRSRSGAYFTSA